MNYQELDEQLHGRCKERRKLANNTYAERRGSDIAIRLHNTDILTYSPDGSIRFDSGGWQTVTTKARMNEYAPGRVYQESSVWYWRLSFVSDANPTYVYRDGMTVSADLDCDAPLHDPAAEKEQQKQKRRLARFARDYVKALEAGKLEKPGGGDCLCCSMTASDGMAPLGGPDHIWSHLEEKYYVPSIAVRACKAFNVSQAANHCLGYWFGFHQTEPGWFADVGREQITKAIKRWLYRECGFAA